MKKAFFIFITVIFLFLPVLSFSQNAGAFDWQILFLKDVGGSSPINEIIRLETGNSFQISINSDSNCYSYIICYDSKREIFVIHNQSLQRLATLNLGPFTLSEPSGTETIYVIMSSSKQTELERLIETHTANPTRQHTNNLYREIVRLQNVASGLGEPAVAIVASGGTSRSANAPQNFASRFSGENLYVRAITIRH